MLVERLKAAGAITLGKTNTPEFGAGSQTFNQVFGATLNPYDLDKTCGGSSGGAAAAVACGMLPFADGSDLGGSLRNPGNFCNVVGFRPTPGRVPNYPATDAWGTLPVLGPIARTVEDVAFLFSAMAGPDIRSPISITEPGAAFARPLARDFRKVRVAWSRNLGGLPVDARVTRVLEAQRKVFESLGCVVEPAEPDLSGADEAFQVLRALSYAQRYGSLLEKHRDKMKDTVVWNIERGLELDGPRIARAMALRSDLYRRMREFLQRYEFLLLPVNQVPPFPASQPYVTEIGGVKLRQLHRLDEDLLVHHRHQPPGDLGAGRVHRRRPGAAGRAADRRALPRRLRRAAAGARLRAGNPALQAPPAARGLIGRYFCLGMRPSR